MPKSMQQLILNYKFWFIYTEREYLGFCCILLSTFIYHLKSLEFCPYSPSFSAKKKLKYIF